MKSNAISRAFKKFSNTHLMGSYIKRFRIRYLILLFVLAAFELGLFFREITLTRSNVFRHYFYIGCYVVLFIASIASAIFLMFQKNRKNNEKAIAIIFHIYAILGTAWGACISFADSMSTSGSGFPIVYFTMLAALGGLLVLNPFVYFPVIIISAASLLVGIHYVDPGFINFGNITNFSVLVVIIAVVSYHTSAVAVSEELQRSAMMKMSTTDVLTSLKNENAYYRFLEKLDNTEDAEYAVIVMDLNGLKHTDDTYGHRFGAFLISLAGRTLPNVFLGAEIFHTGGDEFVCIITKDVEKLNDYLKTFEEKLEYSMVMFEGQELMLSLARGVAVHEKGEKYNDTYQRADRDMYVNKKYVKEKHNIQGR